MLVLDATLAITLTRARVPAKSSSRTPTANNLNPMDRANFVQPDIM